MCSAVDGERGETWAVASVFTEPELRGRGHARAMMDALVARARGRGRAGVDALQRRRRGHLRESGYVGAPGRGPRVPAGARRRGARGRRARPSGVGELEPYVDDFAVWPTRAAARLAPRARAHLRDAARARRRCRRSARAPATASPTGRADWKHDRAAGAAGSTPADAYEAEALVQAARHAAAAAKLHEVRLWAQPWPFPGRADLGGDRVRRVGSLPMIAPLSPSVRAEMWTPDPARRLGLVAFGYAEGSAGTTSRSARAATSMRTCGAAGNSSPSICADSGCPGCSSKSSSMRRRRQARRVRDADGRERLLGRRRCRRGARSPSRPSRACRRRARPRSGRRRGAPSDRRPTARRRCACP